MLFNSLQFLVFFVVVTAAFFTIRHHYRWALLLIASCYFYMAFVPVYILILAGTIVVDYFAGILIEQAQGPKRKLFLICSLVANIGILAVFKYFNFINFNLSVLFEHFDLSNPIPYLSILLPIGLSFHTFQAMSYTVEVYRGNQKAERHFGIYSLYVMFYPQLVAGPIERPQNLLHQFHEEHTFDYDQVTSGLKLMAWGMFKKVVIADRLAVVVNKVYGSPEDYNSVGLIMATVFFAYQIFCDFSGYSDIAIGAARVMGFKLMTNFNKPYHARSIDEFWKRWHISLSTWFKDYLYIPLGGNRVPVPRWYFNLFIVFLVSGLWHGANWTFVIWGALHGFYLVFALMTKNIRSKISSTLFLDKIPFLDSIIVFFLVAIAWVFFRASDVHSAWFVVTHMFTGIPEVISKFLHHQPIFQAYGTASVFELMLCFLSIIVLEVVHHIQLRTTWIDRFNTSPSFIRWTGYAVFVFSILLFGEFSNSADFIYFQF